MTSRARKILAQLGSFVLAGVLLYLALRGVDFGEVGQALREADYGWIAPLGVVVLLSHLVRAWRWQVLLEALPPSSPEQAPRRVSLKSAFYSLMIGYMVNYAAPRLGEVVRTANLSAQQRLSFSGVLGTVVVERILDVATLAVALVSVFLLLLDRSATLHELFVRPIAAQLGSVPVLALLGLFLGAAILAVLLLRATLRRGDSRLGRFWSRRVAPILASFKDGLATLLRSPRRFTLVFSTAAMWLCYMLMAYIPMLMFGMTGPGGLTLLDAWSIMCLGALGIAVPSPGGVGSYHYITIQALVYLFGVGQAVATSYAVFVHGGQLVLYVLVGVVCLLLQGTGLGALRATTQAARDDAPPATAEIRHDRTQP